MLDILFVAVLKFIISLELLPKHNALPEDSEEPLIMARMLNIHWFVNYSLQRMLS